MSFRNYYETSSYGRNRDIGRNASTSTERAATVTAKYTTTPSYKSSSIPIVNDRSAREETPISAIANRYASYSKTATEKASPKYEKKDYSLKLSVPTINTNKSRDVSPVSTTSKYCLSRTSRHSSPDRRTIKTFKEKRHDSPVERDKDIPNKTDKTSNYSGVSNYKLYPRASSYTRPSPRSEVKPEVNVNRYAIGNRLSTSSYLRSPTPIKRPSVSPVNVIDINKIENLKTSLSNVVVEEDSQKEVVNDECLLNGSDLVIEPNEDIETVTVVTRHTSPTPPGSSTYVRMRRADMAKTIEKIISRPKKRPPLVDKEMQSDRLDDPTRSSRFGSTSRTSMTNWTYYSPNVNSYTGYAGRYSTQYSNLRESNANSYDRSSRSRSKEPIENKILGSQTEHEKVNDGKTSSDATEFEEKNNENKNEDTSEIIINVNLTLKQTRSSSAVSSSELISPEITITNSHQLPPQPPKSENSNKLKKSKVRKSSTDSSSDSSSKKVVKKRTKSASSTGSEQSTEKLQKSKVSKNINNTKTSSDLQKGPLKLKYSKCRENNSPETSVTLSTQSSISEDENTSKSNIKDSIRNSKGEISLSQTEQMLKQLPQNKNEGTEDAKSFLIRALAPVTNLFKLRHQDNTECGRKENSDADFKESVNIKNENSKSKNNTKNIIVSNEDEFVTLKGIRHVESGERSRWLESDFENKSCNVEQDRNQENYSENKISDSNNFKRTLKSNCFPDDEKPWWLDSSANIPEGIERLTPPRKSSSDSDKSEKFYHFKIRQIDSGEIKDWWSNSDQTSSGNKQELPNGIKLSKSGSDQKTFPIKRIRHVESGERPWWLSSEKNIPEGIEKLPTPPPQEDSDSSDSDEVQVYIPPSQMPPFPLHIPDDEPLGARRSPEGLETPKESEDYRLGRSSSPYENSRIFRRGISNIPYQKGSEKYISRYTDIDDILGTSGQIYSPFMDSILARRTGQVSFDDDECQEIDPTQVRIHDSTAQMPVIKKLRCRSEIIDYRVEDQLDDATLQVFKDGDYGPYLDLDSTLGEQDEELEGLQESRKNSLVLRTQLSVRVHAIIERLLHSQGRELRRALFTLKQILQSDKDLVHEFVANKGLDCLMQVANMADHNYLDYILRALGQILLYVDGMHGVMNHKRCIQWLYSLISSKLRHVVKTALKLLLVFVEYTEKNCLLFIEAIVAVDTSNARQPWYNVMKILQDFDASDTELLIYVTTLINRCLNNIPDRDLYYDQVDSLQDQGIDDIIQLYMSKQGTDLDLLRQLQIFEAVLLYEDGDETGTALKQLDESVITSLRKRSHNLSTTTRRKSKKQEEREKGNQRFTTGLKQRIQNGTLGHSVNTADSLVAMRQKQIDVNPEPKDDREILLNREHSIKDIAQRLTSPLNSATDEKPIRVSDMAGIVSKAKEELAKSKSKEIIKSPTIEKSPKVHEIKVSENDLHWEELKKGCLNREFHLCDLDFSDLRHDSDDEMECHQLQRVCASNGPPPPPPSMLPPMNLPPPPPTNFPTLPKNTSNPPTETDSANSTLKKNKKTVKLFWREIQEVPVPAPVKTKIGGSIWDDLPQVALDTNMLEHLFESRSNDLIIKEKLMEPKRNLILDAKRSNAINIAMKKLPTPQTIKAAIMKMDATVIGREGIEKLLTMLPTQEEKVKIQEAQYANPDLPLGSAEQFLLTLASINELSSRLKLWVFKLDFDNLEKEIAEPLMDLKQGIELLKVNKTFKVILATLRSVGSFLNGTQVKGFRLDYLSKVMEVKDTVHKHPLLYHICEMIIEKFPDTTDFFSEVGPVIRASKVDFEVLSSNLVKLEADCKASWDHMKRVAKHDSSQIFKTKINEFLTDAAERIILLSLIKKRVMSRYTKFLIYVGMASDDILRSKPSELLKVISEFALEYRTTRERVLQQLEKRANHRERNKTRGKMIIDMGNYSGKSGDACADTALKELLRADGPERHIRRNAHPVLNGDATADEEIIKSLVRCPASKRRPLARDRRRNRLVDRNSMNRTIDGHQSWPS